MRSEEEILTEYYNDYDEDGRLTKDKSHSMEYITTTKYIEKYLKKGDRILEVGAGTGRYSINYAKQGYQVDSVELVMKNLNILKSKITDDMNITAIKGNCMDLNMYKDNTFDVTLVLGPLYHLYNDEDVDKAIKEVIRVTKKGGKIFIAYISNDAVVLSYGVRKGNLKKLKKLVNKDWEIPKVAEEIFATYKIDDFDNLINKYDVKEIETITTDGIAPQMQSYINEMDDEDFEIYMDYHLSSCMRKELFGYSTHLLKIIEKN